MSTEQGVAPEWGRRAHTGASPSGLAGDRAPCVCLFTGEGQYGKVYTCISVDTGELMAMKEVSGLALHGRRARRAAGVNQVLGAQGCCRAFFFFFFFC